MTRTVHLPPLESSEFDSQHILNVVIAYQDFETGKHAKKTYDFLVENLSHDCRFTNQMWKFEVLSVPKLREMAAKDAALADIVIISCHGTDLPPEVKAWIELWITEPHHPIALVALCDCPDGLHKDEARSYLADIAQRGKMEFFAQPDEWPGSSTKNETFFVHRDPSFNHPSLSALAGMTQDDIKLPRWGINE